MDCPVCLEYVELCTCDRMKEHDESDYDCDCWLCLCESAEVQRENDFYTSETMKGR